MKPVKPAILPEADQPEGASVQNSKNRFAAGICVLLVLAVFAVFGQTVRYEFVNFDDDVYFSSNYQVKAGLTWKGAQWAFRTGQASNWHPLTWLSLMLDAQLFGTGPAGPHLTNVLLHAASTVLLFLLLNQMTGAYWRSAFVAAIFAIHPLHVESVAWVVERKDVLSGLFFMLTLLMYARYAQNSAKNQVSGVRLLGSCHYWLAVLFFALGLMSKPMLVTLPFVLLLLDWWPLGRVTSLRQASARQASDQPSLRSFGAAGKWRVTRFRIPVPQLSAFNHLLLEKLPFFLLSAASCVATVLAQREAIKSMIMLPFTLRFGNALISYVTYIGQTIWPDKLVVFYPYRFDIPIWQSAGAGGLLLFITLLAIRLARRFPYFTTGWLWYLGMLVPVIGSVQVGGQSHADRYTYLPQIGLSLVLVWAMRDWTASWRWRRQALGVGALSVIAALMACSWKQTSYWHNSESLWTHTLACTSDNSLAHVDMGVTLTAQGRLDEAIEHFQKALKIHPNNPECHNNFGVALRRKGRVDEAIVHFQKALEIRPDYPECHNNLGVALRRKGQVDEAIVHFQKALEIRPDQAEFHNGLGITLVQKGQVDEAIAHYQKAIQLEPDYADAHNNLGIALLRKGQPDEEAMIQFQKAIKINPDYAEAHYNLSAVFGMRGRLDEAVEQCRKAIQLKPDYADAHGNLANVLTAQGRLEEAIPEYRRTLELVPDSAQAHFRFGQALQAQRNFEAAIKEYQKALDLAPRHLPVHLGLAWLLATCPEATLRDGGRAVELAQQAERLGGGESPQVLDTLAAAYAEAGRYPEAVETAKRALNLTATQNNQPLAEAIQNRLKLYEAGSPYHEKP
jgi:tetratricopeptide (TPR) repeat protein